jgi:hypothetical protein
MICSNTERKSSPVRRRIAFVGAIIAVACATSWAHPGSGHSSSVLDASDANGVVRTVTLDGQPIDPHNAFFQSLGSNGRSCATCHVPTTGWGLSPIEIQKRFDKSKGLDPLFRTNDGTTSPHADVSTLAKRRAAFSMLLSKGVIRVGLPIPPNAEFELTAVDDPYGYASAAELSLFRRPLPATNLRFLTTVMWDGRESYGPLGTTPILSGASPDQNNQALFEDLEQQARDAIMGHAQGSRPSDAQVEEIARFELNLATAQRSSHFAGLLSAQGGRGGPENILTQPFYVTMNDVLGGDVLTGKFDSHAMTLYDQWTSSHDPGRAAVARGAALFAAMRINVTGVAGLNDDLNKPVIIASCASCHDAPNIGSHSVALPIDIGVSDGSRRTPDMPLYTLRNKTTGEIRQTTDPGRALLTGKWNDIGKFKGPILRGLSARAPYFHDGSAATLDDVVEYYDNRFHIGFTDEEKDDLVAFLGSL